VAQTKKGIQILAGSAPLATPPSACSGTGGITREYWTNTTGNSVTAIPVNTTPTSRSQLSSFEAPSNVADNYGQRIRGYICAPATGNYTFYIAGDDDSELWLSTNENPANKRRIADIDGWTYAREWTKYSTQRSASIYLQQGTKYYVEALHKEGTGGDNLVVGWTLPNSSAIAVIPGANLIPFSANNARMSDITEVQAPSDQLVFNIYPNPNLGKEIHVQMSNLLPEQTLFITMMQISGQEVYSSNASTDINGQIDISIKPDIQLNPGVYILSVKSQNDNWHKRIIVQ
jgi:hypothetical protein